MPSFEEKSAASYVKKFVNSTNRHIFLTGKAGTGKTTLLKEIVETTHKNTVVAAPTGIAAINAGGVTLHSLFQLPFGMFMPESRGFSPEFEYMQANTPQSLMANFKMHQSKRKLIREMELLIIDEVSMLRADLLDAIDTVLRSVRRKRDVPFGGLQILFIGDLLQLPPVVKDAEWGVLQRYYGSAFFFDARVLKEYPPVYVELEKIYRQSDAEFVGLLNHLRNNEVLESDMELLNAYYKPGFRPEPDDGYVHLTTHNKKADKKNFEELKKLDGQAYKYKALVSGDFSEYSYPVEEELELKLGAQVMFLKNDISGEQRYFNGKIGHIITLSEETVEVGFDDGTPSAVLEKYTWENKRYSLNDETNEVEESVIGRFEHYPLKLAWAITIHKSQGLTFEKAIIDIDDAFAPGQVYVAMSRLTSLSGLVLTNSLKPSALRLDPAVLEYSKSRPESSILDTLLKQDSFQYIRTYLIEAFDFNRILSETVFHSNSYNKEEGRSVKQRYREWAVNVREEAFQLKGVADKFLIELQRNTLPNKIVDYSFLLNRVVAARKYFDPLFEQFSKVVCEQISLVAKERKVKKYLSELRDLEVVFYRQHEKIHKVASMLKAVLKEDEFNKHSLATPDLKRATPKLVALGGEKKRLAGEKKASTKEISFKLYKEGKGLDEIAKERGLHVQTIEGHLAFYITEGELDVYDFLEGDRLEKILKAIERVGEERLAPVKEELGDGYGFSEIKLALAHFAFLNQKIKK